MKPYIFIIGFNKSGTTSIHELFAKNGFSSIHWDNGLLAKNSFLNVLQGRPVFNGYDHKHQVFSDLVYRNDRFYLEGNSLFKEMDKDYSDAFFIYNRRNMADWIKSRIHHPGKNHGLTILQLHMQLLKTKDIEVIARHWTNTRLRFEEDLRNYFAHHDKFIELDIENPDFVKKLSQFIKFPLNSDHWQKRNINPHIN